jgi:hypothetical protein
MAQSIATRRARFSYLNQHQQKISTLSKPAIDGPQTMAERSRDAMLAPRSERQHAVGSDIRADYRKGGAPSRILSNTIDTRLDIKRPNEMRPSDRRVLPLCKYRLATTLKPQKSTR